MGENVNIEDKKVLKLNILKEKKNTQESLKGEYDRELTTLAEKQAQLAEIEPGQEPEQ